MIKSRWIIWAVHVACIRLKKNVYKMLVGKPEDLDKLEDNVKMDVKGNKMGWYEPD
jgi:hypothetical protein